MAKGWHIIQTYTGYENKIERIIREISEAGGFPEGSFLDVKVPVEEVTEISGGKKKTVMRKFLPGYVFLELNLNESNWKAVCTKIRRIDGVSGFVGAQKNVAPLPIPDDEAREVLQKISGVKTDKQTRALQFFSVGDNVKITDGSFASFTGIVKEVLADRNKLKISVGIFGRETTVEVDVGQVQKM